MKRLYMVLLLVCLLMIGGGLAGCGKAADSADSATMVEENESLTDNPSVEAVDTSDKDAIKPSESTPRYVDKTAHGLSFKMESYWGETTMDNGYYVIYPSLVLQKGCVFIMSEDIDTNAIPKGDAKHILDDAIDSTILTDYTNASEISRTFYVINEFPSVRHIFECDKPEDIELDLDTRVIIDTVMVLSDNKLIMVMSVFGKNAYENYYNDQIDTIVKSIKIESGIPTENIESSANLSNTSIRPEFKEALDSYEAFFDKYIAFMTSYNAGGGSVNKLSEYTEFMTQYADTMQKMGNLQSEDLTDEELAYYLEVTTRISTKLLSVSGQ